MASCLLIWRRCHRFRFFLSAPRLGFPAARAVSALIMSSVMSSVPAGLPACLLDDVRRRHRFAFPRFAPHRLVVSPRLSCRETGSRRGCLLRFAGVVRVFSTCLAWCRYCLKTLLGNLLKTCLGKLLKTFTSNLLKTVKHIPLPISFRLASLRFCVAPCLRLPSRRSLSFVI